MRRVLRYFKLLQVLGISFSLLPLSTFAECVQPEEPQSAFSRFVNYIDGAIKHFTDGEAIARYCYMPNTFPLHSSDTRFSSIPAIPRNFEDACSCFENLDIKPDKGEREAKLNRLKELKYRKDEFETFVKLKRAAEDSLLAMIDINPQMEMPKACEGVFGANAKLEGDESCQEDIEKLVNVQLNVEPFALSPEADKGVAFEQLQGRRRGPPGRATAGEREEAPEAPIGPNNPLVYRSQMYLYMDGSRAAIRNAMAADLVSQNGGSFQDVKRGIDPKSITPKDIARYYTSGIHPENLERSRVKAQGRLHEFNYNIAGANLGFDASRVAPFSGQNEVDKAAAKLLADSIRGGTSFINQAYAKAAADSNKDLLANVGSSPDEKIGAILKIAEVKLQIRFDISARPLKVPINPNLPLDSEERFLSPNRDDSFEKAVFDRYSQMAKTFNLTSYLMANPSTILNLEKDGVSIQPAQDLEGKLIQQAENAYKAVEDSKVLEATCQLALDQRKNICLPRSDKDLENEKLLPQDVNVLAAVDLKKGDEIEYGKTVCNSFFEWKNIQHGTLRSFFSSIKPLPEHTYSEYLASRCDVSTVPIPGEREVPLIGEGCVSVPPDEEVKTPTIPDGLNEGQRRMMAGIFDSAGLGNNQNALAAADLVGTQSNTVSFDTLSYTSGQETASGISYTGNAVSSVGGFAGDELGDAIGPKSESYEFVGPQPADYSHIRPRPRPTDFAPAISIVGASTEAELSSDLASISSPSLGVDSISASTVDNVGAVDPSNVTSSGFDVSSVFQTNVSDVGRNSIYDTTIQTPLLPELSNDGFEQSAGQLSSNDIKRAQGVVSGSNDRYDQLLSQYEDMKKELESIKSEAADKETNSLIAELKKQISELKDSRKDLESKIEEEKNRRETRDALAAVQASSAQTSAKTKPIVARSYDVGYRPAAQPTYSADASAVAPSSFTTPTVNTSASYANQAAIRRSDDSQRSSDFSAGTLSSTSSSSSQAAVATRVTSSAPQSEGLRLTSQAFDKLSSNDFQSLYESNQGGAIYVEKSVADGNGNRNLVVEKYVPEVIEGEVIYVNQGEVATAETKPVEETAPEEGPSRAVASVAAPEVVVEEETDLRRVKEVARYQDALYSPIHQQLIDKIQAAVASQRQ